MLLRRNFFVGSIFVAMLLMALLPATTSAKENFSENNNAPILETTSIDLNKLEKQEVTITDENGNEGVLGAEPVSDEGNIGTLGVKPITKGTTSWHIYWYTGAVNMSYYLKVKRTGNSAIITKMYNRSAIGIGGTIQNQKFAATSKSAKFSGNFVVVGGYASINVYLKAWIKGTKMHTSAKG